MEQVNVNENIQIITKESNNNQLLPYSKLSAWQKRAIKQKYVMPFEWHHTGKYARRTAYYSLKDFTKLKKDDFKAKKVVKVQQPDLSRLEIHIFYEKAYDRIIRHAREGQYVYDIVGLDIRKKDNMIIGAGGRRLDSDNYAVRFLYKDINTNSWQDISKEEVEKLGYKMIDFISKH